MFKQSKRITISSDNEHITSVKSPEPVDEMSGRCPACGSENYRHRMTLVQLGFIDDDCLTIMRCDGCNNNFHYWYQVEAAWASGGGTSPDPAKPV